MLKIIGMVFFLTVAGIADSFDAKVVRVIDGDTLYVQPLNRDRIKIRMFGIDAPELRQRDGAKPGRYLAVRLAGNDVKIEPKGTDKYGRTLAIVYDKYGTDMNKEMIRLGLAWVYVKYTENPEWLALEAEARRQKIGIWRRKNPTPPWTYRIKSYKKKKRR